MERRQGEDVDALAAELSDRGVVSVERYLDKETCEEIYAEVNGKVEDDEFEVAGDDMTGSEMMSASRTILDERSGERDEGMLDIFNIDETIPEIGDIKHDEFIAEVIDRANSGTFTPENINIYFNRSVTDTRGHHFDSYSEQYKAFIYLTDVPDEAYGPYSYIRGSHKKSLPRRKVEDVINRLRGRPPTDAITYDENNIINFTAPKGTLIISDQTGYHRGIPQEAGRERMLISNSHTSV